MLDLPRREGMPYGRHDSSFTRRVLRPCHAMVPYDPAQIARVYAQDLGQTKRMHKPQGGLAVILGHVCGPGRPACGDLWHRTGSSAHGPGGPQVSPQNPYFRSWPLTLRCCHPTVSTAIDQNRRSCPDDSAEEDKGGERGGDRFMKSILSRQH